MGVKSYNFYVSILCCFFTALLYQNCSGGTRTGDPLRFTRAKLKFSSHKTELTSVSLCLTHMSFKLQQKPEIANSLSSQSGELPVATGKYGFDLAYLYKSGADYFLKGFLLNKYIPLSPNGTDIGEFLLPEGTYSKIVFGFSKCYGPQQSFEKSISYNKMSEAIYPSDTTQFAIVYDEIRDIHAQEINEFEIQSFMNKIGAIEQDSNPNDPNTNLDNLLVKNYNTLDLINYSMPYVTNQSDNSEFKVNKIIGVNNSNSIFFATGQWNHVVTKLTVHGQPDPTFATDFNQSAPLFDDMFPGTFAIEKGGSIPRIGGAAASDDSMILVTSTDRNEDRKYFSGGVFNYYSDAYFHNEDLNVVKYDPYGDRYYKNSNGQLIKFKNWPFNDTEGTRYILKYPEDNSNCNTSEKKYYCREVPGDSITYKSHTNEESFISAGFSLNGYILLFKIKNNLPLGIDKTFNDSSGGINPTEPNSPTIWPKNGVKHIRAKLYEYDDAIDLEFQPSTNKILLMFSHDQEGYGSRINIMRFDPLTGAIDSSFASSQSYYRRVLSLTSSHDMQIGRQIAVDQQSGDIYAAGTQRPFYSNGVNKNRIILWRLNASGEPYAGVNLPLNSEYNELGFCVINTTFAHEAMGITVITANNKKQVVIAGRAETIFGSQHTMTVVDAETCIPDESIGVDGVRSFYSNVRADISAILLRPDQSLVIGAGYSDFLQYFLFSSN